MPARSAAALGRTHGEARRVGACWARFLPLGRALTACLACVVGWLQTQSSILSNVDQDDGSDALVNAILVARGDALPTEFAGASLPLSLLLSP
jgi:hypothetical protein